VYLSPYFFLQQHIIFSKNIVLWQVRHNTLLFVTTHYFSKDIVLCAMSSTQYFLKK